MSDTPIQNKLPVTWQDYANLWANNPAYREQYKVIKPTLEALGIVPQDIDGPAPWDGVPPVVTPGKASANFDEGYFSDDDDNYVGGGNDSTGGGYSYSDRADSTLGPGLPPQAEPYREYIENASRITGVPASLIAAMIHDESRWDPNAGTVNGEQGDADTGLMQVGDDEFAALQARHPELQGLNKNDPAANILAGAFYLTEMRDKMMEKYGRGDWEIALRAYNSGENGVDPNNLSNLPAGTGTASYVDKIMSYWNLIEEGGTLPA